MNILVKTLLLISFSATAASGNDKIEEIHLKPIPGLTRADIYVVRPGTNLCGILVLCPGSNGNGKDLLTPKWMLFARQNNIGLVALSFASSVQDLKSEKGYYYPSLGAGQALLNALHDIYKKDFQLLLYGMSGGAHFTARFVEWKPERIISWCAYTAAWWDRPKTARFTPPGIVACGDLDVRYEATHRYFLEGRMLGKPWTWVSISRTAHEGSPALDDFVRVYFAAILHHKDSGYEWRNIETKKLIDRKKVESEPILASWMPDEITAQSWTKVHQP